MATLVNVADRADQTRYVVAPVEFTNSVGVQYTVPADATDTTTAFALVNEIKAVGVALGFWATA